MAVPPWLLKTAVHAARNPKKTSKAVLKVLLVLAIGIGFIIGTMFELLSCFNGHVIDENFDPFSIEIFEKVSEVNEEFYRDISEEIKEIEERIIEENTYTVTHADGTTSEECDVTVYTNVSRINYSYSLAHINYAETEVRRWKNNKFDRDKLYDFLDSICEIREIDRIEEDDAYYIWNEIMSAEDVADLYFPNDGMVNQMYTASYELYFSFLGSQGIVTDESFEYINGELQEEEVAREGGCELPAYYQNNYKSVRYGNGTIASSGCAPTSLAMVISGLTGEKVTPKDVVSWTGNRYYTPGKGSSWSIFSACAKNWGLTCRNLGMSKTNVIAALQEGKPVIASMGPKTFTKGGHIIVLRGVTTDGYFLVNDPNQKNLKKYGTDRFKTSVVFAEAKNFWSFE